MLGWDRKPRLAVLREKSELVELWLLYAQDTLTVQSTATIEEVPRGF
jgi:hypothetical protein